MLSHLLWPHRCSFQDVDYPEGHQTSVMSPPLVPSAPQKQNHQAAEEANWNKWHWFWATVKASSQHFSKQASEVRNQHGGSQRNHRGRFWMTGHCLRMTAFCKGYWWGDNSTGFVIFIMQTDGWYTSPPCKAAVPIFHLQPSLKPEALSDTEARHHELTTAPHTSPGQKSCYHLPTVQGKKIPQTTKKIPPKTNTPPPPKKRHHPLFCSVLSL